MFAGGTGVRVSIGVLVGTVVGVLVGTLVGTVVGVLVGACVGALVGTVVGALVGSGLGVAFGVGVQNLGFLDVAVRARSSPFGGSCTQSVPLFPCCADVIAPECGHIGSISSPTSVNRTTRVVFLRFFIDVLDFSSCISMFDKSTAFRTNRGFGSRCYTSNTLEERH